MSRPTSVSVGATPVPSLGEVLADRTLLGGLPISVLVDLRRQLRHLDADLDAVIADRMAPASSHQDMTTVLGVDETARRLDTSPDSLYRKRKRLRLGYIDPLDGRLKFTGQEIAEYVRRQKR